MRGTMLWFNLDKDLGVIVSADGERLPVSGTDFRSGIRPAPRSAGTVVDFTVEGDERHATGVSVVPEAAQRRARMRGRRYSS